MWRLNPNSPKCHHSHLRTLILRPVWPLEERCTYAVALTKRLVGASGKPVESPFAYVNHRDQSKALARLPELLARYGLAREDIAFASTPHFVLGMVTLTLALATSAASWALPRTRTLHPILGLMLLAACVGQALLGLGLLP